MSFWGLKLVLVLLSFKVKEHSFVVYKSNPGLNLSQFGIRHF